MDKQQKEYGMEIAEGLSAQNKKKEKKYLIILSVCNFKLEFDETGLISYR